MSTVLLVIAIVVVALALLAAVVRYATRTFEVKKLDPDTSRTLSETFRTDIVQQFQELFYSIDPKYSPECYGRETNYGIAEARVKAIFHSIDATIEDGYDNDIFDSVRVRLLLVTTNDIREMTYNFMRGARQRIVADLAQRLRASGVPSDIVDDALRYKDDASVR